MRTAGMGTLVVIALTAGAGYAQEPRRVTLDEALRLAAQNQPAMVQARQDVRVATAQERQAFGAFLPSLNANLSTSKSGQRVDATSGQVTRAPLGFNDQYGISGSLDLFTGFRRGANRRAAGATTSLREATQLRQEYAVALSTKQAFFNALAAAELVAVAETRLRRADEQLKLTAEKLRLGATTRSDSLRGRVEYGNAQLQLIQARADLRFTQATLGRAIGVEGSVAPVPDSALETRLGTLDTAALRHEALANAPSVREAEASVLSARASLGANRAAYFPTLTASGSSNWARADSNFLGGEQFGRTWSLRLQVSYPIFNGFTRETNIITADANATAAEARLRDARLLLDASLSQVFASLDAAVAKTDIARVSVAAAEEDLRMQRERYRLGSSTIFEVLTSQVSLDQAQVDLVRARYDYLVARAQIEALVGHSL